MVTSGEIIAALHTPGAKVDLKVRGVGQPLEAVMNTLANGEWEVRDEYDLTLLQHSTLDLDIVFWKERGKLVPRGGTEWMTSAEKSKLTGFVTEWLPTYHRNRFMQLVEDNNEQT